MKLNACLSVVILTACLAGCGPLYSEDREVVAQREENALLTISERLQVGMARAEIESVFADLGYDYWYRDGSRLDRGALWFQDDAVPRGLRIGGYYGAISDLIDRPSFFRPTISRVSVNVYLDEDFRLAYMKPKIQRGGAGL